VAFSFKMAPMPFAPRELEVHEEDRTMRTTWIAAMLLVGLAAMAAGTADRADAMTPAPLKPAIASANSIDTVACRRRGRLMRGEHYCRHVATPFAPAEPPAASPSPGPHHYFSRW
jgi:hypothetical protein